MNVLFFALRRADLCVLRFGRRALAPHGLTPARFDLLYLLSKFEVALHPSDIAGKLGVSRPVITRMVRSLVGLGLVRRIPLGRLCIIELTREGRARLRAALVDVKKPNDREVPERFGAARRGLTEVLIKWESRFTSWQQFFGKKTWLLYPYDHPDD